MLGSLHYSKMMESRERERNDKNSYTQGIKYFKGINWYNSYGVGLGMEEKNIAVHTILSVQYFSQHFPTFIELLKF